MIRILNKRFETDSCESEAYFTILVGLMFILEPNSTSFKWIHN